MTDGALEALLVVDRQPALGFGAGIGQRLEEAGVQDLNPTKTA
jgi:hypothetical protein